MRERKEKPLDNANSIVLYISLITTTNCSFTIHGSRKYVRLIQTIAETKKKIPDCNLSFTDGNQNTPTLPIRPQAINQSQHYRPCCFTCFYCSSMELSVFKNKTFVRNCANLARLFITVYQTTYQADIVFLIELIIATN